MHKRQSYLKGVKCNSSPGESKRKRKERVAKATDAEILMCTNCTVHVSKCKGTCVYRGE